MMLLRLASVLLVLAAPALADQPSRPTISFALEAIRDRALVAYRVETIAMEGLKGLAAIDPSLEIAKDAHGRVQLRYRNRHLASFALPQEDDITGWSLLIEQASHDAALASPILRKADGELLTEAVIDGFLSKLDIFSHYAGPIEARERRAARNGFGGIGVRYDLAKDGIALTEIIPDSPAAQAKLKVGDRITTIDDIKLAGLDQADIVVKLRGPIASAIKLTVNGAPVTLRRSLILPPTVTSSVEDGIGVIAISAFSENTAGAVTEAIKKLKMTPGFKGIVLDLRGNPGGLLDQGIGVADQFIEQGRILATRGRHPGAAQNQDARPGDPGEGVALVVLVDGRTASAAEILAADLQDSGRAVLVGSNSFGKGAIQTVLELPNHGEMNVTWSRFFTPSGYALHGLGLLPNICTVLEGKTPSGDKKLAGGRAASPEIFAAWRGAAPDDMAQRVKLRGHCPAGNHAGDKGDLAIARQLLNDRALYARAMAVAAPVSTASSQRGLPVNPLH